MQNRVTTNPLKLRDNLTTQLDELETLQSMFYNPGELRVDDLEALQEIRSYVDNKTAFIPPYLDFTINLLINDLKFELCITLPHEYPDVEPDCFVRNHKQNREQHARINKDLGSFLSGLSRGEPCVFSAVCWLQENAENYVDSTQDSGVQTKKSKGDEKLVRYWIYSHHIYSKTKRREILNLANLLNITGFCMPGKPGIICVEGGKDDCDEWWQTIKAMNWKRIFCKVDEECKGEDDFLKFKVFEEVVFQNNSIKCNHMDMGELHKYLEDHKCSYVFKDLFGVEAKTNS